jgi:hypothetical protein
MWFLNGRITRVHQITYKCSVAVQNAKFDCVYVCVFLHKNYIKAYNAFNTADAHIKNWIEKMEGEVNNVETRLGSENAI